jgi:UDP-N-acetylglucosamine diphosphorylase / glucose-1-phosphate thymidylyltransferase / UDP-N-acetylgalactosamine diphosphorylase / glucosamine-1-phosphate N-acetyltransferase / galactosamine-1-phosphate N-acetyltransferase
MDAVILAAGLGTRLRPRTLKTPKPLLPVQGRPIIDWILGALPPKVDRIVVVVHYLAEQVEDYLRTQKWFPQWSVVRQEKPQGTGDALRQCQQQIDADHFLVLNGDDLFGAGDLAALADKPAGLLVHAVDEPRKFGIAFLKPDGTLAKLMEKPDMEGRQLANTGAYVFPRRVFDIELKLSPRGEFEITDYVSTLASQGPFHVVQASFWWPIGTTEAWEKAERQQLDIVLRGR